MLDIEKGGAGDRVVVGEDQAFTVEKTASVDLEAMKAEVEVGEADAAATEQVCQWGNGEEARDCRTCLLRDHEAEVDGGEAESLEHAFPPTGLAKHLVLVQYTHKSDSKKSIVTANDPHELSCQTGVSIPAPNHYIQS